MAVVHPRISGGCSYAQRLVAAEDNHQGSSYALPHSFTRLSAERRARVSSSVTRSTFGCRQPLNRRKNEV